MAEKKASNGTGARTSSKDTRKVHGSEGKKGRVDDEPTEEMIRNVMHFGVIEPIVVRKNQETGKTEVVAGRKRTKACREANRRLVARVEAPLRIAVVIRPTADGSSGVGGKHEHCDYFVLDLVHDAHAFAALAAYATSCETDYPALYDDLTDRLAAQRSCDWLSDECFKPAVIQFEKGHWCCTEHAADFHRRGHKLGSRAVSALMRRGVDLGAR